LIPGDHIISSYGYANECFRWFEQMAAKHSSMRQSHIDNFWEIISEEHRRWRCSTPLLTRWLKRSRETLENGFCPLADSYVTNSFLARGFKPNKF